MNIETKCVYHCRCYANFSCKQQAIYTMRRANTFNDAPLDTDRYTAVNATQYDPVMKALTTQIFKSPFPHCTHHKIERAAEQVVQ